MVIGGRRVEAHVAPSPRRGDPAEPRAGAAPSSPGGTGAPVRDVTVQLPGGEITLRLERLDPTTWRVVDADGAAHVARSVEHAGARWLHLDGETLAIRIESGAARRAAARRPEGLEVPMPGAVTQVAVSEGEIVTAGQPIVVVEAMKMEHVIRAPHAGRVVGLQVRQGQQVDAGAVVAELRAVDATPSESRENRG